MSTLLVDELFDGVEFIQEFRITRPTNIVHVRPWIYLEGTLVDGDFQIEVRKGTTVLETKTINYTDINAVKSDAYAHGFIRFDFDSLALAIAEGNTEETYNFRFTMENHTTDTGNFLAIARMWDIKIYDTYGDGVVGNQAPNDAVEPAGFELFETRSR